MAAAEGLCWVFRELTGKRSSSSSVAGRQRLDRGPRPRNRAM
ncbi:hypothetical protein BZL30_6857 [Mycobacterium kansasii]|uniref:Uncharacterized protein n=1 Tax=Mycobacterium kansasii TaxID=1768 RepID=A0A1V3WPA7_MYCKA|nr:hypothetical protein BZL30_6857 [Mycobacterium kansasii]